MKYLMDSLHADGEGLISGDEMSRFIRDVAMGTDDAVLEAHHGFWLGKEGFLWKMANW